MILIVAAIIEYRRKRQDYVEEKVKELSLTPMNRPPFGGCGGNIPDVLRACLPPKKNP